MVDIGAPDYANTPTSEQRPQYEYNSQGQSAPHVSIITAYYNVGPVFQETVNCIRRMSFVRWEWLIVDDGSTDTSCLAQLEQVRASDTRIRILHQKKAGSGVARNHGAREARGKYLMLLDSDCLVEPTFLEKALWVLETQPQIAVCNSRAVIFGRQNALWPYGFEQGECNLVDNYITNQCVIRGIAFGDAEGFAESIRRGHEDWDFWLRLASVGHWGHTIPEYLTWYRRSAQPSRLEDAEGNLRRTITSQRAPRTRHVSLHKHFPAPVWTDPLDAAAGFPLVPPLEQWLNKPKHIRRVLLIIPWFQMGGADKVNLEIIRSLQKRGYQMTVVATMAASQPWLHHFTALTPDVFCLSHFLAYGDYPRFLSYLIRSRDIDAIILSNSELGYDLLPFIREAYPTVPILDYNHMEEPEWNDGGYPGISAATPHLTLSLTCSEHLRRWMIAHGAAEARVRTCYVGVDVTVWKPNPEQAQAVRAELCISESCPIILFVGRIVDQKRPLMFVDILRRVAEKGMDFAAVVVGDGPLEGQMRSAVRRAHLASKVQFVGALSSEAVRRVMAAANILLLPSRAEGLALVLYEAMAVGVVPVAADVGGHRELVTPDCGVLVGQDPDEVEDYARAVIEILADAPAQAAMSVAACRRVREKFDGLQFGAALDSAVDRAIAAVRNETIDPLTQRDSAFVYTRLLAYRDVERSEARWNARAQAPIGGRVRRLREAIAPIGSTRYHAYHLVRQRLRQLMRTARTLAT